MKKVLITASLTLTLATFAYATAPTKLTQTKPVAADTLKKDGVDLVCKMKVKAGNTKTVTIDKVTYGFCSESCKKSFIAEPKKYIKK